MRAAAAAVMAAAASAQAQQAAPRFALVTGETVAPGRGVLSGKLGWPGVQLGYQHGIDDTFDAGVVFDLLYGVENTTNTQFGMSLGAPLRLVVMRRERLSVQLAFTPGVTIYTAPTVFGFNFPGGVTLGIQVAPALRLAFGADLIMKLAVSPRASFVLAPLFGPALEYWVDRNLSLSLDTRFGPVFTIATTDAAGNSLNSTQFGFRTQIGAAYKLP